MDGFCRGAVKLDTSGDGRDYAGAFIEVETRQQLGHYMYEEKGYNKVAGAALFRFDCNSGGAPDHGSPLDREADLFPSFSLKDGDPGLKQFSSFERSRARRLSDWRTRRNVEGRQ